MFADVFILPFDSDVMPEFTIPDYVSDPPVDWPHYDRDDVARRWLKDIGPDARVPGQWTPGSLDAVGTLADRLGTSAEHVGSILKEATLQYLQRRMLREVFDPVPHESEARRQFVRLVSKTHGLPSRSGHKVWVLAEWEVISASWPSLLEQACADVRAHAGP